MSARSHRLWACTAILLTASIALAGSAASSPVSVAVLKDTGDQIHLSFEIGDPDLKTVEIDGVPYTQVSLPGEAVLLDAGAPKLVRVTRSVIIPNDAAMTVTVDERLSQYYELADIDVVPSKGNLYRNIDPADVPYTFGTAYRTNAFYPGAVAELSDPYIVRDFRGQTVRVHPLQYNPVTRVLRVYTEIVLAVEEVGLSNVNVQTRERTAHTLSRAFHDLYQHHFVNYGTYAPNQRYAPLDEQGEMIVISHGPFMTSMAPFVAHKNGIGIPTSIVDVATIGNNSTSIKSYIQGIYNDPGRDLAFVLLVGDYLQVATPQAQGGAADPTYGLLAGSDHYPEIIVGRFSAETTAHVDTQVERSIEYEQNMATTLPWFWKAMGVASNQGPGDDGEYDNVHLDNIRTQLLANGYTEVDQIYDPSATSSQVSNALNAGRGYINYTGHGSTTSWSSSGFSNTHINALTNDNMLPFIISVACVNGQFDGYTCFGEAWLRATNGGEPTGAIGAYMSSINQSWDPPMSAQDEFADLLCPGTYICYGTLCFAGSCQMIDDYGSAGDEMYDTWHIFGDPSLCVVGITAPPTGIWVTPGDDLIGEGNFGGPFSPDSIVYTIENKNVTPVDYEVSADVDWVDITSAVGTIPGESTVQVTVAFNTAANWLDNGVYNGTVSIANLTDGDGDTTRGLQLTVGVPGPIFQWNMDSDPGWDVQGNWAWGQPTGANQDPYGNPDPTAGFTGANVYGYNLLGDYEASMPERHLTTTALDCSDLTQCSLRFMRCLGVESASYDHAYLRISNNGTNWVNLWQNSSTVDDGGWVAQQYDISAYADNQATVYIRWTMGPTDSSWQYCGWNIDDVELWALAPANPYPLGDLNCDGVVDFGDINPFVAALTDPPEYEATYDCDIMLADIDQNGSVGFEDINPFVAMLVD